MKDDPVKICPECGGDVKRLLYPVGIVFKGSGWYVNDSRKPDTSADSGNGSDSKSGDGAKAEGKPTESKPAETASKEGASKESKPTETKSDSAAASK